MKAVTPHHLIQISVVSTLLIACRSAPKNDCDQTPRPPRAPSDFVARLPYSPYPLDSIGTGSVIGSVADSVFGAGIPGASVSAGSGATKSTYHFAYTDSAGGFLLRDLPPGTRILTAARIGYVPTRSSITIQAGKVDTLRFRAVRATNLEVCTTIITS
jgi:hypothetical protein